MNFVLRTAYAKEKKKKRGSHNPDVHTIIIIILKIADVPFARPITRIHCVHARTTVEDHGCAGQGRHATQTT